MSKYDNERGKGCAIIGVTFYILLFCSIELLISHYWWVPAMLMILGTTFLYIGLRLGAEFVDDNSDDWENKAEYQESTSLQEILDDDKTYMVSDGEHTYLFNHKPTDFDIAYIVAKRTERAKNEKM